MDYSIDKGIIEHIFSPRLLQGKLLIYIAVCLLVLKIIVICAFVNFPQNIFFADITKITLTNLVNYGRQEAGVQPLVENKKLDLAAKLKAEDMVQKGYFSHQSPEGITPWYWFKVIGYNYKYAGENLAIGFFDSQALYSAWLNSPSHRNNLLNPKYKEIGTAVLSGFGSNNAIVVVQLFGNPAAPLSQNQPNIETKQSEKNKVAENIPEESTNEEVLSQYTENIPLLEKSVFLSYNFDRFLQYIIYGFLVIMLIILFSCFFTKYDSQYKGLLFKSLAVIAILSIAALLNKEAVYLIFPRQIII